MRQSLLSGKWSMVNYKETTYRSVCARPHRELTDGMPLGYVGYRTEEHGRVS
jgi:hypothetical protein